MAPVEGPTPRSSRRRPKPWPKAANGQEEDRLKPGKQSASHFCTHASSYMCKSSCRAQRNSINTSRENGTALGDLGEMHKFAIPTAGHPLMRAQLGQAGCSQCVEMYHCTQGFADFSGLNSRATGKANGATRSRITVPPSQRFLARQGLWQSTG